MYIAKLDDIVNKYNNACHRAIKMKPLDVKPSPCIHSSKEINDEDPKFRTGDIVRISKCENIFAKGYIPDCSEEVFVIKKVKTLWRGNMLLVILTEKKLLERFAKKNSKNTKRV